MSISFPKETEQYPVLPAGEYGINEDAELVTCATHKNDGSPYNMYGDTTRPAVFMSVLVRSPEHGFIRVMESLELPTEADQKLGPKAGNWFRQLGVTDPSKDFDPSSLEGSKVIVEVRYRVDKEGTPRNNIGNIMLAGQE